MNIRNLTTLPRRDFLGLASAAAFAPAALAADTPQTQGSDNADSVKSWQAFADRIKDVGTRFLEASRAGDPVDHAEGLRYLARLLARSVENGMAAAETLPMLRLNISTISKLALDASECKYAATDIDSAGRYRVAGHLGNAAYVSFQLYGLPRPGGGTRGKVVSGPALNQLALKTDPDGAFEIMLVKERPTGWTGAWLPLDAPFNNLLVREYYNDWALTIPSRVTVERLDPAPDTPLTQADVVSLYNAIVADFAVQSAQWQTATQAIIGAGANRFLPMRSGSEIAGQDDLAYSFGSFDLGPDDALIVAIDVRDALFWSLQLGNIWSESLDYINHCSSLTTAHATRSSDGIYRAVISGRDPGVANWLDTAGHREGLMASRYFLSKDRPMPKVEKVRFADLKSALPVDTRRVSAEERADDIRMRQRHAAIRWAP